MSKLLFSQEDALEILKYGLLLNNGAISQSIRIAMNALENAIKHRWHNLRKDKNDLPAEYETIMFHLDLDLLDPDGELHEQEYYLGKMCIGYGEIYFENYDYRSQHSLGKYPEKYVIGWRYFDPFEEE